MINLRVYGYVCGDEIYVRQNALLLAIDIVGFDMVLERLFYLEQYEDIDFVNMIINVNKIKMTD